MKKGALVPSLSSDAWISDPSRALDRLMAYFFESDKSQTYTYGNNIASLAWIYTEYASDPDRMASILAQSLETYLGRYYPQVSAACSAKQYENNINKIELTLSVQVRDSSGAIFDLTRLIRGDNTKVLEILDHWNG